MENDRHYLEVELESAFLADPTMVEFLRAGSLDGLWYWDLEDPEHEWMSPEFWRLFGIDPATKEHRPDEWQDIIFPEDRDVALENFERHCADPDHPYDQVVRYRHADGSTVWVRCRGLAIRDETGRPVRMLGAHNDLTAEKRLEAQLRAEVAKTIAANDELASFTYALSHDLKAPINSLRLALSELRHELGDQATGELGHLLDLGSETADRAAGLVDDVLAYTRVVGQEVDLEPVPVEPVVTQVVRDLTAEVAEAGARVESDVDATAVALASPVQLHLLVLNLVANAIKFRTGDRDHVVRVGATRDGADVELVVVDNGVGIPDDAIDEIFEMFGRLHTLDRFEGAGLGLALCRRIVTNHHGTISVTSELGEGSRFVVRLPAAAR